MSAPADGVGEIYLGDGVYVARDTHDPQMIWLRTTRDGDDHVIALGPQEWMKLERFVAEVWPRQRRSP